MQPPLTVAIADADNNRRTMYEQSWRDASDFKLLANAASGSNHMVENRRLKARDDISVAENEVARAKRLVPRILLVDSNLCLDEDYSILRQLHAECPSTYVVLVGDELNDDLIIKALECGARGYVSHATVSQDLTRVASAIDRGEAWVSRKVLGKIIDRIQSHEVH